jgi:esterase/lipase superfamily enzyme
MRSSEHGVDVTVARAFTGSELVERLRSERPEILQFTGHGSPLGNILLENAHGRIQRKLGKSVAKMLSDAQVAPDCLILNNCSVGRSWVQLLPFCKNLVTLKAKGIFDFSLGFSGSFYRAFAREQNFEYATQATRTEIQNAGIQDLIELGYRHGGVEFANEDAFEKMSRHGLISGRERLAHEAEKAPTAQHPGPAVSVSEADLARKYEVWFGTNRRPLDPHYPESGFGPDRDERVYYGRCEVVVPKFHKTGEIGNPWWKKWPVWKDDRLRVGSRYTVGEERFWAELRQVLTAQPRDERTILCFIHGYNVTFDQAAIRAAQIGADLAVTGATAFFSWPSKGRARDYAADVASVEASEGFLRDFLESLATKTGAERIHLIAHSMGNRGLIRAFNSVLSDVSKDLKVRFNQIFLAAPDIDCTVFKRLAAAYARLSARTTMYISSRDKALWGSSFLHDYPRAGYKPPVTIVEGIDTVEVSNIDVSFLGHSYIGAARDVLHDMYVLMNTDTPPERRMGLEPLIDTSSSLKYWRIRA